MVHKLVSTARGKTTASRVFAFVLPNTKGSWRWEVAEVMVVVVWLCDRDSEKKQEFRQKTTTAMGLQRGYACGCWAGG